MFEIVTFPTNIMKQNYCIVLVFLICLAGRSLSAEYKVDKYGHRSLITDGDERDLSLKESEIFDVQPYSNGITKRGISKWLHSSLTYSIRGYPLQLNQSITKNIIRQAFKT